MSPGDCPDLQVRDSAEVARSASEAAEITSLDVDVDRYLDPPSDTLYALEYAFHVLGDVRSKTVVDLGCGSGEEMIPLIKRGATAIGVDLSPDLIEIARRRLDRYGLQAELRVASAYDTGLPDHSADVVFCMAILHHLDLEAAKKEILRLLKPSGIFIFKEPIRFSWTMKQLRKLLPQKENVSEFEYPLNAAQLNFLVEGFQVLSSRNFRTVFSAALAQITKIPSIRRLLWRTDATGLRIIPFASHFSTICVMSLKKPSR